MRKIFLYAVTQSKIYLNEGLISIFFHGLKSILVLLINWIILNKLGNSDYVVWSITSSILMIATASDLGIGQYTVTLLIHSKKESRKSILRNACFAISPLFLLSFGFVYLSLSGTSSFVFLMALFVSFRLFSIPFGALLNATNNFKFRKIIEFISYFLAFIAILVIINFKKDVNLSLLALNIAIFIGSIITILFSFIYVPNNNLIEEGSIFKSTLTILLGSLPFMVNNLTALLTYGGFIWLSSFVLPDYLIAKLSVLHSFLFLTLYQIYDVFLRSKQSDLLFPDRIKFIFKFNRILIFITIVTMSFFGIFVLELIAPKIQFSIVEIFLFSIFVVVEFCYLIILSIVQLDFSYSRSLFFYSIVRLLTILFSFLVYFLIGEVNNLSYFLFLLSLFSFLGLLFSNHHFKTKSNLSIWG